MKNKNPVEFNKSILILLGSLMLVLIFFLIYFSIPKTNEGIKNVGIGNLPPRGNPNAKIKIIEFSDFQCPACKASHPTMDRIFQDYREEVVLYYRYFPLSMHENSFIAAEAAECANEQGKFWEYHNILFDNQDKLDKENLKRYAEQIKLNSERFNSCLDNEETKEIISTDLNEAKALNLKGTPTFFINGKEVFGGNEQELRKLIEEELKK
ncbi:MAG: thioredoxin domain-containing protein [Candidatus Pacearchaeota archaeon]